jgi:hypothetical protein
LKVNSFPDVFSEDNSFDFKLVKSPLNVSVINGRKFIHRVLKVYPSLNCTFLSVEEYKRRLSSKSLKADLYISCGYVDDFLMHHNLILFHGPKPSRCTISQVVSDPAVYVGDGTHVLFHYLSFAGLKVSESVIFRDDEESVSLLYCNEGTIMQARSSNHCHQVLIGFLLENSSFGNDVGFPVFMINAVRWVGGQTTEIKFLSRPLPDVNESDFRRKASVSPVTVENEGRLSLGDSDEGVSFGLWFVAAGLVFIIVEWVLFAAKGG